MYISAIAVARGYRNPFSIAALWLLKIFKLINLSFSIALRSEINMTINFQFHIDHEIAKAPERGLVTLS